MAANDAPKIRDDDDPLWSRVALLPFVHVIENPDPSVKARLRDPAELGPAILAWAVNGCLEWQRTGLGQAKAVDDAGAAYRAEMDPLRDFFDERCVFDPGARVTRRALRTAYEEYAKDNGVKSTLSARDFKERVLGRTGVEELSSMREGDSLPERGWQGNQTQDEGQTMLVDRNLACRREETSLLQSYNQHFLVRELRERLTTVTTLLVS